MLNTWSLLVEYADLMLLFDSFLVCLALTFVAWFMLNLPCFNLENIRKRDDRRDRKRLMAILRANRNAVSRWRLFCRSITSRHITHRFSVKVVKRKPSVTRRVIARNITMFRAS